MKAAQGTTVYYAVYMDCFHKFKGESAELDEESIEETVSLETAKALELANT